MQQRECDLCGKPASTEAMVEGARVSVCLGCARFGTQIKRPIAPGLPGKQPFTPLPEHSIADGFGKIISRARENAGLSRHELAGKIFIDEHELARIEEEKLKPREQIARKLEQELKITIITTGAQNAAQTPAAVDNHAELEKLMRQSASRGNTGGTSLADIVTIKRKQ